MNPEQERLEHLITRCLDEEATPQEQALLRGVQRSNREARRLIEDTRELDQELRETLRRAMGMPTPARPHRWRAFELARGLIIAAAACLATFAWMQPKLTEPGRGDRRTQQAGALTSWFAAPPVAAADTVVPVPEQYERPELPVRQTAREWIVIPSEQPGRYFVIEVEHVQTRAVLVHRDY